MSSEGKVDSIAASHRTGIGGSLAAAVVGLSRHKTRHEALASILGLSQFEPNEAMEIGTLSQPMLKILYERRVGKIGHVPGDEKTFRHPSHDWMICHPDWLEDHGRASGAEFKVAGLHAAKEWQDPAHCQVPQEYYVQCLHNMIVTGRRKWDLAVLLGTEFKIYPIQWSEEEARRLFAAEKDFWFRHVVNREPLPVDGSDGCRSLMTWMHPENKEPLDWAVGDAATTLNYLAEVKSDLDAAKANFDELANKARGFIGNKDGLRTEQIVCTWKCRKDGVRVFRTELVNE